MPLNCRNLRDGMMVITSIACKEMIHSFIHAHMHTYIHTYTHTYIHIHTHILIHKYIQKVEAAGKGIQGDERDYHGQVRKYHNNRKKFLQAVIISSDKHKYYS